MPNDGKDFLLAGISPLHSRDLAQMQSWQNKARQLAQLEKTNNSKGLAAEPGAKGENSKIIKAATEFEALLLHQMMSAMWSTVPKDGGFDGGKDGETYRDMLNEATARNIAEGQGIGIKEVIVRELKSRASKNSAT